MIFTKYSCFKFLTHLTPSIFVSYISILVNPTLARQPYIKYIQKYHSCPLNALHLAVFSIISYRLRNFIIFNCHCMPYGDRLCKVNEDKKQDLFYVSIFKVISNEKISCIFFFRKENNIYWAFTKHQEPNIHDFLNHM